MSRNNTALLWVQMTCLVVCSLLATGCQINSSYLGTSPDQATLGELMDQHSEQTGIRGSDCMPAPPRELDMVALPPYRIAPPDILLVDVVRMAPKSPYYMQSMDVLQIVATGTLPEYPIAGTYQILPNGTVNLGPAYGSVEVVGLNTEEIADAITRKLNDSLSGAQVSVSLLQSAGQQLVQGEHVVSNDGMVNLGKYGQIYVVNMTIDEARAAIEKHLSRYLDEPKVSVDVFAYNSKKFYVVTQGAGRGDQIAVLPITGNETVLDAVAQMQGIQAFSSKRMWIARPAPSGQQCRQILPVNWNDIAAGDTSTNYQLMPGDRLFIAEDRLTRLNATVMKITQPIERVFGFVLLGAQTVQVMKRFPRGSRFN